MALFRKPKKIEGIYQVLLQKLKPDNLGNEDMQSLLRKLPMDLREDLAYQTHTVAHYYGNEVAELRNAEEKAALQAIPKGYGLHELNGINVGCGDRCVNDAIIGIDAHIGEWNIAASGQTFKSAAKLKYWAHDLPFKPNSIDYIVALHILEHEPNPIEVVIHWLDVVKPGGGVGIVVPDWRYTWDSRNDQHPWGHRWNPTPKLMRGIYEKHWSKISILESIDSYKWKMSFDIILRKPGEFKPFNPLQAEQFPTGHQLFKEGNFLHSDD